MKLDVSQLLEGVSDELELEFAYEPDDRQLDDGAELREPARVRVVLTRGPQQLWLRGHIDARVQFTCDRCLKPFESELTTSYVEEYRARAADQEADEDDGEIRTVHYAGTEVDISEGIRQNLLLMLPTKRLCSEDCRGLCPYCGQDLNEGDCDCEVDEIDPRFEVLKRLQLNDADEGSVT